MAIDRNSILKLFEEIENKHDLDRNKVSGVPWWDCLRFLTFETILSDLNLNGYIFPKSDQRAFNTNSIALRLFKFTLKIPKVFISLISLVQPRSPLWLKKNSFIIFSHPRRIFENEFYIDKYTDPFIEASSKKNVAVIERPLSFFLKGASNFSHLKPIKTKNIFYYDAFMIVLSFLNKLFLSRISHKEATDINYFEKDFSRTFNCEVKLYENIKNLIPQFKAEYLLFRLFFKLKSPKKIFIVVSAGYESMICAAKSLNIPTYELQHGSPSRGKLNYDYSSGIQKKTFPDYFLSFGNFWTEDIKFPISKKNIFNLGFLYLNNKRKIYKNKFSKQNKLLFISQPNIADDLITFIIRLRRIVDGKIDFIYKPHPEEMIKENEKRFKIMEIEGISIVRNDAEDLYSLLAKSKWVFGVYSTALYEAVAFNCSVYIVNMPGYELVSKLIDHNLATLISNPNDFTQEFKIYEKQINDLFAVGQDKILKKIFKDNSE